MVLSPLNFGALSDGQRADAPGDPLSRRARQPGRRRAGQVQALLAEDAEALGLVTAAYDEVDWDEEVRLMLEERASFSPDALTGLEANLRFAGPETMETRIFGRLTAWQNWIFQRPNAVGDAGRAQIATAPASAPISTRSGCETCDVIPGRRNAEPGISGRRHAYSERRRCSLLIRRFRGNDDIDWRCA